MRVQPDALARLAGSKFTAETVANIMEFMRQKADLVGAVSSGITLDFQKDEDVVTREDMIPCITLTLRPATIYAQSALDARTESGAAGAGPAGAAPAGATPAGPGV